MQVATENEYELIEAVLQDDIWPIIRYTYNGNKLDHIYDEDGNGLLHLAVLANNHAATMALLLCKIDINQLNQYGQTPVNVAASLGATSYVQTLATLGADVNIQDIHGFTPLTSALFNEYNDTAAYLLNNTNINVNLSFLDHNSAIDIAYITKNIDILDAIINHASYNSCYNYLNSGIGYKGLEKYLVFQEKTCTDDYFEAFQIMKLIGLRYDFDGVFSIQALSHGPFQTFPLEAYTYSLGSPSFYQAFEHYKYNIIAQASLPEYANNVFDSALDTISFTKDHTNPQAYFDRYQEGKPVLVTTGWKGHAVILVLDKNQLYRCNRGNMIKGDIGIETFTIQNTQNIDVGFFKALIDYNEDASFLYNKMHTILGLERIYEVEAPHQTVGNCVWTSYEAALEALFINGFINEGISLEQSRQLAKANFLLWENYDMTLGLKEFIEHKDIFSQDDTFDNMLLRIFETQHKLDTPHSFEREKIIINELSKPEHGDLFAELFGEEIYQVNHASVTELESMQAYKEKYGYYDWFMHMTGWAYENLSDDDKQRGNKLFDTLKTIEQNASPDYVLSLSDLFNTQNNDTLPPLDSESVLHTPIYSYEEELILVEM